MTAHSLLIVERDFAPAQWALRRSVAPVDKHFARWIADLARGRFVMIDTEATNVGAMFTNLSDMHALVCAVAERFIAHMRVESGTMNLNIETHVSADAQRTLEQLATEIKDTMNSAGR